MVDIMPNEAEDGGNSDEEVIDIKPEGIEGERLGLEDEGDFIRKLPDPKLPTPEEVERHFLQGHLPYRNLCPVCVKSKGKDEAHKRDSGNSRGLPEYSFDYCFPGDEMGFKWVVLVGKERSSGSWMATAVPMKGGTGRFAVDKCGEFIDENGDREGKVLIKTDQ